MSSALLQIPLGVGLVLASTRTDGRRRRWLAAGGGVLFVVWALVLVTDVLT